MTTPNDAAANRRMNDLLRDRPGRVTALPNPAGTPPAPVADDAATRKAALDRLNDAIRDAARKTPWPTPDADDDGGEAS